MNIYKYLEYRLALRDWAREQKKARPGFTFSRLALNCDVQPAYLTNVFKERAHLSQDQLFSLCQILKIKGEEYLYVQTLLEWERSGNPTRRASLYEQIKNIQSQQMKTESHISKKTLTEQVDDLTHFYMKPDLLIVHFLLSIEKYQSQPELIASDLNIDLEQVDLLLTELRSLGLWNPNDLSQKRKKLNLHMPKDYPLRESHQNLMRLKSHYHLQSLNKNRKYNFMVTYSSNEDIQKSIQMAFLEFLKKAENLSTNVDKEDINQIGQMNFDLFTWNK